MSRLETTVRGASPNPVVTAGAGLGARSISYPFLDPACPLFPSSYEYIERVLTAGAAPQERVVLAQYLAVAVSWHVLEGWRYLSQAGAALIGGARRTALHLAYYAELRAARSILAGSGVAICDGRHFGLDSLGNVLSFGAPKLRVVLASEPTIAEAVAEVFLQIRNRVFRRRGRPSVVPEGAIGTHVAAWRALKAWSEAASNGIRVIDALRGLRFRGIDWVEACRFTAMRDVVASAWLSQWSMDLKSLRRDSEVRNQVSYGVSLDGSDLDAVRESEIRVLSAMNESWLGLDSGVVDGIDLALANDFVIKSSEVMAGGATSKVAEMWRKLDEYLTGPGGLSTEDTMDALDAVRGARSGPGGVVLVTAARANRGPSGVLARAFLLLRLATALLLAQWREMALRSPGGILAWHTKLLRDFAVHTHLGTAATPADFRDLEEDQVEALDELREWLVKAAPFDSFAIWQQQPALLQDLCRFERAFLVAAAS